MVEGTSYLRVELIFTKLGTLNVDCASMTV